MAFLFEQEQRISSQTFDNQPNDQISIGGGGDGGGGEGGGVVTSAGAGAGDVGE